MTRSAGTRGERPLLDRLRGRHRVLVANLLVIVVLLVVLAQWLAILMAWWQSADMEFGPVGEESSRLLAMAGLFQYTGLQLFGAVAIAVMGAAGAALLVGHPTARGLPLGWRRAVAVAVLAGVGLFVAQAVVRLFVIVVAFLSVPAELRTMFWATEDWTGIVSTAIPPAVELLIGIALVVLALAWWPGGGRRTGLLEDDEDDEDHGDGDGFDEEGEEGEDGEVPGDDGEAPDGDPFAPSRPADGSGSGAAPQPAQPQPRLRPDGSSDSGYDPFRFGR